MEKIVKDVRCISLPFATEHCMHAYVYPKAYDVALAPGGLDHDSLPSENRLEGSPEWRQSPNLPRGSTGENLSAAGQPWYSTSAVHSCAKLRLSVSETLVSYPALII
jgi:hypothetical protein